MGLPVETTTLFREASRNGEVFFSLSFGHKQGLLQEEGVNRKPSQTWEGHDLIWVSLSLQYLMQQPPLKQALALFGLKVV